MGGSPERGSKYTFPDNGRKKLAETLDGTGKRWYDSELQGEKLAKTDTTLMYFMGIFQKRQEKILCNNASLFPFFM